MTAEGPLGGEIVGVPVVRRYSNTAREVTAIRTSVALSERPHIAVARVSGDDAFDALDRLCPADLFMRDGQLLHTLFLGDDGTPLADVYVGNDDGAYFVLADGLSAADLTARLRDAGSSFGDVAVENLSETHTMLTLEGPFAWELLAAVEGPEVIGFPYLSFYRPDRDRVYFRAGQTGEFGYDLVVPRESVRTVAQTLVDRGSAYDLAYAGTDALTHCALENWFFDIHDSAFAGLTPLELQLQWRLSPTKQYVGSEAIRARASAGIRERITAFVAEATVERGDAVHFGTTSIGRVLSTDRSITNGNVIGIALLDRAYAHSGIDRYCVRRQARDVRMRTVSPPFVNNLSLFVNPQRHSYADRAAVRVPPSMKPEWP